MKINKPTTIEINPTCSNGYEPGKTYDIYMTAKDPNGNANAQPQKVTLTVPLDTTVPTAYMQAGLPSVRPQGGATAQGGLTEEYRTNDVAAVTDVPVFETVSQVSATIDEDASFVWAVAMKDDPDAQYWASIDVTSAADGANTPGALRAGMMQATCGLPVMITIVGLVGETYFDLFLVATDKYGNSMGAPTTVQFKTADVTPPVFVQNMPTIDSVKAREFGAALALNEPGKVYWFVEPLVDAAALAEFNAQAAASGTSSSVASAARVTSIDSLFAGGTSSAMQTMEHLAFTQGIDVAADGLHGNIKTISQGADGHSALFYNKGRYCLSASDFLGRHSNLVCAVD